MRDYEPVISLMACSQLEMVLEGLHQQQMRLLTVVQIDETVFTAAKMLFRQYDSAKLSFTDCTSFTLCRANNITKAFAFDRHFQMMGIDLLQ